MSPSCTTTAETPTAPTGPRCGTFTSTASGFRPAGQEVGQRLGARQLLELGSFEGSPRATSTATARTTSASSTTGAPRRWAPRRRRCGPSSARARTSPNRPRSGTAPPRPTPGPGTSSKVTTGDYNGDGRDDVGVLYNNGPSLRTAPTRPRWWTFTSNGTAFAQPVRKWDNVSTNSGSWNWDRSKPVSGDFNGDGNADVGILYNNGQKRRQRPTSPPCGRSPAPAPAPTSATRSRSGTTSRPAPGSWNMGPLQGRPPADFSGDGKDGRSVSSTTTARPPTDATSPRCGPSPARARTSPTRPGSGTPATEAGTPTRAS
ncbi:FG-GAP repeat domain-containing protein [Streptomyces clavuligerus]|uniref:FG-GAP repeat domain-containing protein n=1 Tax=Streptomyces clavuligerus TaxID=1901 RepID=UPI001F07E5CD|nr:VCBS repeat-containing protein [Streptomyces clavuligerus]